MAKCIVDPRVEVDLGEIWEFIARDNPASATKVIESTRETMRRLAETPNIGIKRPNHTKQFADLRSWRVSGFGHHHIFYRPIDGGI